MPNMTYKKKRQCIIVFYCTITVSGKCCYNTCDIFNMKQHYSEFSS